MFSKMQITELSHLLLKKVIKDGDIVLDATAGLGNDTFFLYKCVGTNGKVFSFDINFKAIESTKELLYKNLKFLPENINFILDSHSNIDKYIFEKIKCAIYNLGYIPDTNIKNRTITKGFTTITSIEKALSLLTNDGIILVVCYYAHDNGEERKILENFLKNLDKKILVTKLEYFNRKNNPPFIFILEKE